VPVSRRLAGTAAARGLILGFLATAGATQLFAGYAEIYGLLLPPLFLYVLAALRDLPSSRFPWLPACVLGVLVALHVMSVTLLPSLVLLALVRSEDGRLRFRFGTRVAAAASSLAAVLLMAAVASAIFFALDFDLLEYVRTRREGHLLPLFSEPTFVQSYRMFSFRHLFDVANQYVLAAPAAVMGAFLLRGNGWFHAQRVLLAVAAVPVVIFTIVANPEVGAFRDWDVFSFAAPLVLLWVGASLGRSLRDAPQIGHVALLLIGAAGFHSLSWIAVNADAAAAEARFTRLLQSCPISRHAKAYGWETFSIHSKVTARPEESLSAFDRAIKADPDNPRYWQMAGELCLEMNRDDRARWYLTRALELRPGFVDARFALGIAYFRADEIAEAEALFQHVVAQDPNRADAWYRLGLCHSRRENREEALRCFRAAVEAKPDFADAQIELASLLRTRGEIGAARSAFARFLEVEPEGARAKEVRRLLAEELRETSAQKPRSP
jgi:Tfp pilus assembly protein PilF